MDVVVEQISSGQLMSEEFFLIVFQEESLFELLGSTNVVIQIVWGVVRKIRCDRRLMGYSDKSLRTMNLIMLPNLFLDSNYNQYKNLKTI